MSRLPLPSDDDLPTWLHTALCMIIVAPFAIYLIWIGLDAVLTGHMEPISGPEIGQFFFGHLPLNGMQAKLAGCSLVLLGHAFFLLGLSFTRFVEDSYWLRMTPWVTMIASFTMGWMVQHF